MNHRSINREHPCLTSSKDGPDRQNSTLDRSRFEQFRDQFIARPFIVGINFLDAAARVHDDCAQVVGHCAAFIMPEIFADLVANGGDVQQIARQKTPMRRMIIVSLSISLESRRRIIFCVKRNGEEMPILRRVGHCKQFIFSRLEVRRHQRAKGRIRTAREEKREREGLAFQLFRADCLPQFIREMIIGQRVADLQRVHVAHKAKSRTRWQFGRARRAQFGHMLDPAVVRCDDQLETDEVARTQAAQFVRVADFEGHRHCRHVMRNFLVPDDHGFAVRFEFLHDPLDLIELLIGAPGWGRLCGRTRLFLARKQNHRSGNREHQKKKSTPKHHRATFPKRLPLARALKETLQPNASDAAQTCLSNKPRMSPTKSSKNAAASVSFMGKYFPVAPASNWPERLRNSPLASNSLSLRFSISSAVAIVSSPGRSGLRNRTFNSAQYAKRRVCTAHAQTMISSSTVAMMPPCTVCLNPMYSGRGTNFARTILPSVSKRSFRPLMLRSPQTKQEAV